MRRASPFFQRELVCMHWHRHQDHASCPVCRLLCWAHARISSTSPQSMHGPCGAWHTEIIYHGKRLVGYACRVLRSGSEANLSTVRPRDRCCTHARVKRTSSLRATPSNLKPQRSPNAGRGASGPARFPDSNVAGSVDSSVAFPFGRGFSGRKGIPTNAQPKPGVVLGLCTPRRSYSHLLPTT